MAHQPCLSDLLFFHVSWALFHTDIVFMIKQSSGAQTDTIPLYGGGRSDRLNSAWHIREVAGAGRGGWGVVGVAPNALFHRS